MAAALCTASLPNDELVALLQDSISCVQEEAFHPVLYQTLGALHEYVANQQRSLVRGLPAPSNRRWKKTRPSFWKETSERSDGVVASGWLEVMSSSNNSSAVVLDPVILLLVAVDQEEPYLRIAQETIADSSSPPRLETRNRIPLRSLICDCEDLYGDPRLMLNTEDGETITLKCGSALAATSWAEEIQQVLKEDAEQMQAEPAFFDQSVEVERDVNDVDIVHANLLVEEDTSEEEEEETKLLESSNESLPPSVQEIKKSSSKQHAEEKMQELEASALAAPKSAAAIPVENSKKDSEVKPPQGSGGQLKQSYPTPQAPAPAPQPAVQPTKQQAQKPAQPAPQPPQQGQQVAATKAQQPQPQQAAPAKVPDAKQQAALNQQQQHAQKQQQQRMYQHHQAQMQHQQQRMQEQLKHSSTQQVAPPPKASSPSKATPPKASPPAPTTQLGKEMLVEQQKKLAETRRKQDLESKRRLAREEQKKKDLEARRKFLEKEKRKQALVAKNQRPTTSSDASANLQQIDKQMASLEAEIKQAQANENAIKAEIEQRKHQPLQLDPGPVVGTAAAQKRMEEQQKRKQELAAKNKAAMEKRRQDLEEQRKKAREEQKRKEDLKKQRLAELEKRKQDLMTKAKEAKANMAAQQSTLSEIFSDQIQGLDAEAERKRKEEAAKAKEPGKAGEAEDPEAARKRISEQARQQELEEDMKRTSTAGSTPEQGSRASVNLATSASSEGSGVRRGSGLSPSSSSPSDPFGHLQVPISPQVPMQQPPYPQQPSAQSAAMHRMPPSHQYPQTHQHFPRPGGAPFANTAAPTSPQQFPSGFQQQGRHPYQQPSSDPHRGHAYPNPASPSSARYSNPASPSSTPYSNPAASYPQPPPFDPVQAVPQPQPKPAPASAVNHKYTTEGDDEDPSLMTDLKRKIIGGWALQPPEMQGLRPINALLCSIQSVYPPANDLPSHEYFSGWKAVSDSELGVGQVLEEKKLSKAVRKLRFFLHPDKLPRDLTDEQLFVCKLLWDITNDAWAEYKKSLEDLDWMNS